VNMCEPTWASFSAIAFIAMAWFLFGVLWESERAWKREDQRDARRRAHRLREKEGQQ
jgi:hypothetical protein